MFGSSIQGNARLASTGWNLDDAMCLQWRHKYGLACVPSNEKAWHALKKKACYALKKKACYALKKKAWHVPKKKAYHALKKKECYALKKKTCHALKKKAYHALKKKKEMHAIKHSMYKNACVHWNDGNKIEGLILIKLVGLCIFLSCTPTVQRQYI